MSKTVSQMALKQGGFKWQVKGLSCLMGRTRKAAGNGIPIKLPTPRGQRPRSLIFILRWWSSCSVKYVIWIWFLRLIPCTGIERHWIILQVVELQPFLCLFLPFPSAPDFLSWMWMYLVRELSLKIKFWELKGTREISLTYGNWEAKWCVWRHTAC